MLTRRKFLRTAQGLASSVAVSQASEVEAAGGVQRPNFLIFMPDQHQGQAVLGDHPAIMPNLRRFASQGIAFTRAFCTAPHCCPSRASFQTGLYPSEHGVFNNVNTTTAIHANPSPGIPFFSQILKEAGYELAYSGKWHVARDQFPQDFGWNNLNPSGKDWGAGEYVPPQTRWSSAWQSARWAKARGDLQRGSRREPGQVIRPGWGDVQLYSSYPPRGPDGYETTPDYEVVHRAVKALADLAKGNKPWCLMVSTLGGHDPYRASQTFLDLYQRESIPLPPSFRDTLEDKPRIYQRMRYQYWSQLSDLEVQEAIRHYWAMLTMQDALFGLLLDALDQSGQAANTMVIYTADHGDYAGSHGLWAKGVPSFQEAYHIPCVIRWPRGVVNPGRRVDALVSMVDFAPTILDAAGVQNHLRTSGSSLLPWMRGEPPSNWRDAVFTQLNGVELYYTQRIVITKDYKYVYNGFDYDELYDLRLDSHEMVNLAFPNLAQSRAAIEQGRGLEPGQNVPWPPLSAELADTRRNLLQLMWRFAQDHRDQIFNPYLTVAMAPLGPAVEL
jgi:arylsulfatase A-like enzyme